MKDKSDKWRLASLGLENDKQDQPLIHEFIEPLGRVIGSGNGYGVFAKQEIHSGSFIEEVPALVLDTTHEDIKTKKVRDEMLEYFTIKYPFSEQVFDLEGHPLVLPLGNFILYRENEKYNAVYEFSRTFNTFFIRAVKKINKGEEIVLKPIDSSYKQVGGKKMGCGCGKKKKQNQNIVEEQKIEKQEVSTEDKKESPKFKSMVDGETLKTIDLNND